MELDVAQVVVVPVSVVVSIAAAMRRLSKDVRHGFQRIEAKIGREFARQREERRDGLLAKIAASSNIPPESEE